ncbi:hypothetical protein BAU15_10620 [Enterococcus sp. JM4C]|uniref:DUF6171 family protein n=1 Tax=Candidatus Enterococcus huntleyi TaxID=1857217 RepID=UPI0013799C4B|nr:DUF6171 family protein [Enterococcus sp. JM4C]KAF1296229.1 hypothetical protein BAU15_10620 [Enterococcus sp. JM4C]
MACVGCEIKEEAAQVDVEALIEEQLSLETNLVEAHILEKRLEICSACPFRVGTTCGKCGCYYKFRANLANKDCPAHYWQELA